MHLLLLLLLTAKPTLVDDLRGMFETSPERAKTKLACKAAWKETTESDATGKKHTLFACPDADQQVLVDAGKVFGVGVALERKVDSRRANTAMKSSIADLGAAGCKALRNEGQLAVFECSGGFAVILLDNWNSKDDTSTVSALFGDSAALLPVLGLAPKKK